jgi:hypothetical protein
VNYTRDKALSMEKDVEKIEEIIIGLLAEGGIG